MVKIKKVIKHDIWKKYIKKKNIVIKNRGDW